MAENEFPKGEGVISLPRQESGPPATLEGLLFKRRSRRLFTPEALTLEEAGRLLFAAQGVVDRRGFRTAPSAGALYPLELYLVAGQVTGLAPGIYKYIPQGGELFLSVAGDRRADLARACLGQAWMAKAAVTVAFCGVYTRTMAKYGERGVRYVEIEAGCASQNLALAAAALDLGTVVVGAFEDENVWGILGAPKEERPLLLMPVGRVGHGSAANGNHMVREDG